ncbi:D-glycero-D-manno-heptose 1,7-bisphosphate phosphatase [Paenibacillus mucilaginosus]|uniref:D-glycero-alpha-D-manno-heptose-1,7-bisphosphate 7-phosphatase n=1 Tax=Paenibacillus mucilaginosus TaxID=61624 RepID=UPI003D1D6332
MNKAVFLDRDGVINECMTDRVKHVNRPGDLYILPGVAEAISKLKKAGFLIIIVTNQGGVGLRFMKPETLQRIHERLLSILKKEDAQIHDIAACIHKPKDGCACRKQNPGMIMTMAEKYDIDLANSFMVGDMETDIAAGKAAGTKTIRIGHEDEKADFSAPSLLDAIPYILKTQKGR